MATLTYQSATFCKHSCLSQVACFDLETQVRIVFASSLVSPRPSRANMSTHSVDLHMCVYIYIYIYTLYYIIILYYCIVQKIILHNDIFQYIMQAVEGEVEVQLIKRSIEKLKWGEEQNTIRPNNEQIAIINTQQHITAKL